ncbi:B-cell receptor CD22-like [Uranotaenia lowii]|uniref:B-cell receptor CD22-like n=1 Tax=Uranotaenia lowii TaxID=190385 RepID=UPI00247AB32A|nr:B-cell receptor CD22-like [Uranotaenia lowii]
MARDIAPVKIMFYTTASLLMSAGLYPPIVSLHLGSTLSADDIKDGDDVYFECHVQANPPWRKLHWLHDGVLITHNASARVIRSNQSLVLQKVNRNSSGNYSCSAINAEGETVSNHLVLRIKYAPMCATDKIIIVGAFRSESLHIPCEVHADPPPRQFNWKFNNSGETLEIGKERFAKNGSMSILSYTPVSDQDYGTLTCWGQNEVGQQQWPCFYQVVLAAFGSDKDSRDPKERLSESLKSASRLSERVDLDHPCLKLPTV